MGRDRCHLFRNPAQHGMPNALASNSHTAPSTIKSSWGFQRPKERRAQGDIEGWGWHEQIVEREQEREKRENRRERE